MALLLDEVRKATREVPDLGDQAGTLWPKVSAALRATCDDVERRLSSEAFSVLLVGDRDARRAFLDAAIGIELFALAKKEESQEILVTVRHAERARWTARRADGTTIETENDRTKELDADVARAETELARARERAAAVAKKLDALRAAAPPRSAQPTQPAVNATLVRRAAFGWRRLVAWLVAFVTSFFAKRKDDVAKEDAPASARLLEEMVPLERELLDGEAAVAQAEADLERVRTERAAYLEERYARFLEEVQRLVSGADDAVELDVEHPSDLLRRGIQLVDAPVLVKGSKERRERAWKRIRQDITACVAIGGTPAAIDEAPHELLGLVVPQAGPSEPTRERIAALFDRLRRESKAVVVAIAVGDVEARIKSLAEASAKAERDVRDRIARMERERVPTAARFREEQMARMRPVVDEAARRILKSTLDAFRASLAEIASEWTSAIEACTDRAAVQACVGEINATAQARLEGAVEKLGERLGREMQTSSETLQSWVLDEMSVRYRTLTAQIEASPVILSDVPEDVPAIHSVPLPSVMDSFEERRVGIGLGGVAAGAAIGTLILPGIGTALGAMVGVFAGFLEGLAPLKKESISRVRSHLDQVERDVASRLAGGPNGLARDLRISLEETLDAALERREDAIKKLIEMEQVALVRENGKLDDVGKLRKVLDAHGLRFAALSDAARAELRDLVAARRPASRPAVQETSSPSIGV